MARLAEVVVAPESRLVGSPRFLPLRPLEPVAAPRTGCGDGPGVVVPVAPGSGHGSGPGAVRVIGQLRAPGSGDGSGPSVVAPVVLRHPTPSDQPADRQGAARGRPPPRHAGRRVPRVILNAAKDLPRAAGAA